MTKRPRYRVAKREDRTIDGIVFDSKSEMSRYNYLKLCQRDGLIYNLELQPEYKIEINGEHYCTYHADFKYFDPIRDQWVVEDVKSFITAADAASRLRIKAAELYHNITVEIIVNGEMLTRKKKSTKGKK